MRRWGVLAMAGLAVVASIAIYLYEPGSAAEQTSSAEILPDTRTVITIARGTGRILPAAEALSLFSDYVEKKLSVRFRIRVIPDPEEYQRRIVNGEFDLIHLAPLEYVESRRRAVVEPVALALRGDGSSFYHGAIVTRDASLKSVRQLVGKRVTYVDEGSASGYLYPVALLLDSGIDPRRDFEVFEPSGSHENVVLNINSGRYDAGFVRFAREESDQKLTAFEREALPLTAEGLPCVALTAPIPNGMFGFSRQFVAREPELSRALRQLLLSMADDPEGRNALTVVFRGEGDRCEPARDTDYVPVRRVVATLEKHGYPVVK